MMLAQLIHAFGSWAGRLWQRLAAARRVRNVPVPRDDLSPVERSSRPAYDSPTTAGGDGSSPAAPAKPIRRSAPQTPNDRKPSDPATTARDQELETSESPPRSPSSEPATTANAADVDSPVEPMDDLSPVERSSRSAHDDPDTADEDGSSPVAPAKPACQSEPRTLNDREPSDPAITARNQGLETSEPSSPASSPSSEPATIASATDVDSPVEPMDDPSHVERSSRPARDDPAMAGRVGSSPVAPAKSVRQSDHRTPNDRKPSDPAITAQNQEIETSEPPPRSPSSEPATIIADTFGNEPENPGVSTSQADADHRSSSRGRKNGPVVPREIGARRRSRRGVSGSDAKDRPTLTPRPELICRKAAHQWEVVLSADEERDVVEVRHDHDGRPLVLADGVGCLPALNGRLSIDYADGSALELSLFDGVSPLIFKLRNNWSGDGRRVGGITHGHFIVIAPKEWRRMGQVPVEPEVCVHEEFQAHYFVGDGSEAGGVGGFEECNVELTTAGFELSGATVFDDAEDGDLFIGDVPVLRPASSVVWARIGEEREGGWKGENFKPADRSLADVLQGRQGRFFLRVYDATGKLLDSGEFRYCADLREIRVDDAPYTRTTLLVPPATGHLPTEVRFIGSDGATVEPTLTGGATHAAVGPGGIVRVDPHPHGDRVCCALESEAGRVDIIIKLPRIWWRKDAAQGEDEDGSWRDSPLMMTRQEFREQADVNATIRILVPPQLGSVTLGFDDEQDRSFPRRKEASEFHAVIPLGEFRDYRQIDQRLDQAATLKAQCGNQTLPLIGISADPAILSFRSEPARIEAGQRAMLHWTTRNAEPDGVILGPGIGAVPACGYIAVTPTEITTFTLRIAAPGMEDVTRSATVTVLPPAQPGKTAVARVARQDGRWRRGRGYSFGELRAADLTEADVRCHYIRVDSRRRSTHSTNVDTLRKAIR